MRSWKWGKNKDEEGEEEEVTSFLPSLNPVSFFQISVSCPKLSKLKGSPIPFIPKELLSKALLPDLSFLTAEKAFAEAYLAWSEEGLSLQFSVKTDSIKSFYPDISHGDSVEIMIDTRDIKTSGYNTRFCHHFFFLAEEVEGKIKGEITKFRTEDTHPLCNENDLHCKVEKQKNGYLLKIFIPSVSLYGYDPEQFDRIGFTYRVNRFDGEPQHFSSLSEEFQIEQQPSLWSSISLK